MPRAQRAMLPDESPSCGRALGKVILLGEHSVVYDRSALAASIDRELEVQVRPRSGTDRISCCDEKASRLAAAFGRAAGLFGLDPGDLEISVSSALPESAGLGSSAALSVALVRALAAQASVRLDDEETARRANEIERVFHVRPSGLDTAISAAGGIIRYRGTTWRRLRPPLPLTLVVALSPTRRSAAVPVEMVRRECQKDPALYETLFDRVEELVAQAEAAIAQGDLVSLGRAMSANHRILRRLGVSTPELDQLVEIGLAHGALGAKLTGAGQGGAIICLRDEDDGSLEAAFSRRGLSAFTVILGCSPQAGTRMGKIA